MNVRRASLDDLDALAPLFDAYRQFYGQPPDEPLAHSFLAARLERGEAVVLLAEDGGGAVLGFAQLYPTFCSVAADRIFVLYDLFVVPASRRSGVATTLLRAAADVARDAQAVRLELSTALTNHAAQTLYEREGWQPVREFQVYALPLAQAQPPHPNPQQTTR